MQQDTLEQQQQRIYCKKTSASKIVAFARDEKKAENLIAKGIEVRYALSGNTVNYTDADAATFPDRLKEIGVPERIIMIASGFSEDIKNKQYEIVSNDLENLLGRKPASLKEALNEIYKKERV